MSHCANCGAAFTCAMADGGADPCWCTALPPVDPLPPGAASCWCPACLARYAASQASAPRQRPFSDVQDLSDNIR